MNGDLVILREDLVGLAAAGKMTSGLPLTQKAIAAQAAEMIAQLEHWGFVDRFTKDDLKALADGDVPRGTKRNEETKNV